MYAAREGPQRDDEKGSDERFYESVGDPLAGFRQIYGGGKLRKDGKDPFGLDPDIIQSKRTDKLVTQAQNMGINGW